MLPKEIIMNVLKLIFIISLVSQLTACVNYQRESGVENTWRSQQHFLNGVTTSKDVLVALGPPSQILQLKTKVIYYYLHEQVKGEGLVLLVYNTASETTIFDRAIFIFDDNNLLEDYSFSKHMNELESQK